MTALWSQTLTSHPSNPDIGTALCVIGTAEPDLGPCLDGSTGRRRPAAAWQLWEMVNHEAHAYGGHWKLVNAFWADASDDQAQVAGWLDGDALRDAVRAGADTTRDESTLRALADLADLLGA